MCIERGISLTAECSHACSRRLFKQISIQGLPTTIRAPSAILPRLRKNPIIIPFFLHCSSPFWRSYKLCLVRDLASSGRDIKYSYCPVGVKKEKKEHHSWWVGPPLK